MDQNTVAKLLIQEGTRHDQWPLHWVAVCSVGGGGGSHFTASVGDVVVCESDGGQVQVSRLLCCATPPVFVLTTPVFWSQNNSGSLTAIN